VSDTELKPGMLKVGQTARAAEGCATDELREKRWRPLVHLARVKGPMSTGPRPERPGPW
jgi:hypothetical protein